MTLIFAALIGVGVGMVAGSLGIGGGMLAVPVLVYLLGQDPHAAVAESLVVVLASSAAALPSRFRRGQVRLGTGLIFGMCSLVGAGIGTWLNRAISGEVVMLAFAALLAVVSALMGRAGVQERRKEDASVAGASASRGAISTVDAPTGASRVDSTDAAGFESRGFTENSGSPVLGGVPVSGVAPRESGGKANLADSTNPANLADSANPDNPASEEYRFTWRRLPMFLVLGTLTGILVSFFGIGGGFAVVPLLVLVMRYPIRVAQGTSFIVMSVVSVASILTRVLEPVVMAALAGMAGGIVPTEPLRVDWLVALAFALCSGIGASIGSPLSNRARASTLTFAFVGLLVAIAVYTVIATLT
ncbi:sulfite exporter TauE/SafE family protein [Mobiluncus mulieris]|uniref:sulfite exporter TauE/SafE family protein n=1 Tax=Mobiluncus mulieris TaxID=2052 RepID=UPI0014706BF7|nr:sulfite exporter TauE/SafE family protein [Mobiluncus mulieris]MCU9974933.1 sulfite exporter TauE/SafE family protein [Mobiluncus mulieris]MCV0009120.1 sulfite exporter TauE/SafE family protein [Mobiluncus mulieris]NMW60459.1 sulfite exporter TauE/SafE family protein [Mobiluncus mulieris]NMW81045.1 sulfite exporter TauE/SafE family protein [Mobiluncus mulieris]